MGRVGCQGVEARSVRAPIGQSIKSPLCASHREPQRPFQARPRRISQTNSSWSNLWRRSRDSLDLFVRWFITHQPSETPFSVYNFVEHCNDLHGPYNVSVPQRLPPKPCQMDPQTKPMSSSLRCNFSVRLSFLARWLLPTDQEGGRFFMADRNVAMTFTFLVEFQIVKTFLPSRLAQIPDKPQFVQSLPALLETGFCLNAGRSPTDQGQSRLCLYGGQERCSALRFPYRVVDGKTLPPKPPHAHPR